MKTDCKLNSSLWLLHCCCLETKIAASPSPAMIYRAFEYRSKKVGVDFYLSKENSGFAGVLGIVHCDKLMRFQVPSVVLFQITPRLETFKK